MMHVITQDIMALSESVCGKRGLGSYVRVAVDCDGFHVVCLSRMRTSLRSMGIPLVGHVLRMVQSGVFGIEIGKDVHLGEGVWFVHPLGIVVGGNSRIGKRVRFFGNNTVGTAKDNGYPVIEDDVHLGAGARVLGPVKVGARSKIGANAVVLTDIPPDSVAVGVPARVISKRCDDGL
jgi:serine O-acetyltransferase